MNKPFTYERTIHFQDTDTAGVVYFANGLSICHEAYEASLVASGINLKSFFKGEAIAVPITYARIDFFKPMFCGDRILVSLVPTLLNFAEFEIAYQLYFNNDDFNNDFNNVSADLDAAAIEDKKVIAKAVTKHTCIDTSNRKRCDLSRDLHRWITITIKD